jgi:hypothetical protein
MAIGAAAFLLPQSQAGTFSANFNDNAAPAGTFVNGTAAVEGGVLKVTKATGTPAGGFVIDDLDAGAPVYGFTFAAKILVGGGTSTPADGFSINFAPDIDTGASPGEEGMGSGIRISFDTYDNANENPPAPSIDFRLGGNLIATKKKNNTDMLTFPNGSAQAFADISLTVTPQGALTLVYKGETIFNNVYFPGYQAISGGRLAIGGRTGGSTENVWFDDVSFSTVTTPQIGVVTPPQSITVLPGTSVTFAPVLNNVDTATFQWLKNGTPIASETSSTLTIASPTLADSGAKYSLKITDGANTVTTAEGTLTVVDIPTPAPTASFDFTSADGSAPAGTTLIPGAAGGYITYQDDGTGFAPGVLHLTDAQNDERAVFIVEDLNAGAPVYGITAHFKLLIGGGTTPPADGFSFNFASDIPDSTDGNLEDGIGTGLTVGFDIYDNDNGGGEAPSIDVRYGGALIAQQKVPISFIDTGDQFADVIIRLENDGTIDVVYKGIVVFSNLTVPGFSSITGGRVALAARTGGANENIWVDDLAITTVTTAGDLHISTQPLNKYVIAGQSVTLSSAVNDTTGVTYQWSRNGTAIAGATSADYTFTAAAADNGAQYTLTATRGGLSATSNPATLTVLNITPTVSYDFNSGTTIPAGVIAAGNVENPDLTPPGYVSANGGVDDSGVFHLTDAFNGEFGAFVVQPLLGGAEVSSINVAFDVLLRSGGTPADGFSFNWDDSLPDATIGGSSESGTGNGLTIAFGLYNGNTGGTITVKWNSATVAQTKFTFGEILTGNSFRKVIIKVTPDGKLDLVYGDRVLYTNLQLPGYAPITNGKYGFYGRTGGLNADQWLDNIVIQAIKSTAPLRITSEPSDALLFPGSTATFSAIVSDPVGVTYQWSRNGTPINGATSATYTTPALTLADNGATYTLTATGPGGTAASRAAVAHVVEPLTPITNPDVSFDFNDSTETPVGTTLYGVIDTNPNNPDPGVAGYITPTGGVNDSGVLHLTDANNGQGGTFYIRNFDGDNAVSAFTANFKMRIGGGSATPADGASFSWGTDVNPDSGTIYGENGGGSGLIVSFDTYHNDNEQAPEFELLWQGSSVADHPVPIDWLVTDPGFADVFIRLESDGTVDVQYEGRPIFSNVKLPNFQPLVGANFAIGARTGGLNANQWLDDIKIVTTSSVSGPSLTVARNTDGSLNISWTGGGTLQATSDIGSNQWSDVTTTTPATVSTTGTMRFFRVSLSQ